MADHGREARHPFLDESVVEYLASLPLSLICDLSLPTGIGDKRILRRVAQKLGVAKAATLQKRAVQFGSRIANQKGTSPLPHSLLLLLVLSHIGVYLSLSYIYMYGLEKLRFVLSHFSPPTPSPTCLVVGTVKLKGVQSLRSIVNPTYIHNPEDQTQP